MTGKPISMSNTLTSLTVALMLGLLPTACGEKKAETPQAKGGSESKDSKGTSGTDKDSKDSKGSKGGASGDKAGEGEGEGEGGETDGGTTGKDPKGSTTAYKFCDDLKGKLSDAGAKKFADEICGDLAGYRAMAFKGTGDTKVKTTSKVAGTASTYEVSSMIEVAAKASDYYDMVRLQYVKPADYKTNFEEPEKTTLDVKSADKASGASFKYENTKNAPNEIIVYEADTKFVTLKEGEAYAFETKSKSDTANFQGMQSLVGLVVVVKAGTNVEVFSRSTQVYNNGDQATDHEKGVKDEFAAEQKRSHKNGKVSSKAAPLLK